MYWPATPWGSADTGVSQVPKNIIVIFLSLELNISQASFLLYYFSR